MLLSNTTKDFERIENLDHIEKVKSELDLQVSKYFKLIAANTSDAGNTASPKTVWSLIISEGINKFEKESKAYKDFFCEDKMEEFEEIDDPKVFKSELKRDCPIIRKTLNSKMEELQDWKEDFARANPQELLDTFANFLDFQNQYVEDNHSVNSDLMVDYEDFEALNQFSEDEDMTLRNVIGAGIKTTIIHNLNPHFFCKSVRRTLYGLSFLTENINEITPSRTSEFIMVDDNPRNSARGSEFNFKMEHNYWYPYNLFMLYTNRIYILLKDLFHDINISLEEKYRFVYVNIFLEQICVLKSETVRTMMGGDQDF